MNSNHFSVVHRLPQSYRWSSGLAGIKVEAIPLPMNEEANNLIGLKLLSPEGDTARQVLQGLNLSLREIQVESNIIECDGELCLFVKRDDESATMCRLKNIGTAIAESVSVSAIYPF
ncbi:YejG family protein [Rouxiella sp. T17]|uniref:YejG family protein n=1 Tax=Rouxiella sp. T17 TaxID=3085684 RepID=UPI002FC8C9A4